MKTKQMFVGLGVVAALGAAVVPMAAYADVSNVATGEVDVALQVGGTISMSLTGTTINPAILTSQSSTDKTTVATVTSNSTSGYTLSAATSSSNGSLIGDNNTSNTIDYTGTSFSTSTEGWALSVGGNYKAISGNKIALAESNTVADNDDTTVTYNFSTTSTTAPDTYKTTLTYTAQVK